MPSEPARGVGRQGKSSGRAPEAVESERLRAVLLVSRALAQVDDEDELLELIASTARESLGYGACMVSVRDESDRFVHRFGAGCSEDLLAELRVRAWPLAAYEALHAAASRIGAVRWVPHDDPVRSRPDVRDLIVDTPASGPAAGWTEGSLLFVPMVDYRAEVIGLLRLDGPASGQLPTDADAILLETFADLAAAALQLLRGRSAARQLRHLADAEHDRLRALLQAMSSVSGSLELGAVLGRIVAGMRAAGGFGRAAIYLHDPHTELLHVRATAGLAPDDDARLRSTPVPLADFQPLMLPEMRVSRSYLFDHRRFTLPARLQDLLSVPDRPGSDEAGGWHPLDSLTIPMTGPAEELVGLISVDEPHDGRLPDLEGITRMELFADECATAVVHAQEHQQVRNQAERDPLTGLLNRRSLLARLDLEVAASERAGDACSVLFCDLDHFKLVNDRHGHPFGDEVLEAVARCLTGRLRSSDAVARYGGEEFVAVLPDTDAAAALRVAESLRESVAMIDLVDHPIHISIGVATSHPRRRLTAAQLLASADGALYAAKHAGRNRVELAGPSDPASAPPAGGP